MNRTKPAHALFSAALALALAGLACSGGAAAPTLAPTKAPQPSQAVAAPSDTPQSTSAPTTEATSAATTAATEAATAAASEGPTSAPTATAAPLSGSLDLHSISAYLDNLQYYRVDGLLTNGTDKPVDSVQLSLQLTDSNGKTVLQDDSGNPTSTVTSQPLLSTIDPGGTTPFEFWMNSSGLDTTGWKAVVKIDSSSNPTDLQRVQVVIENNLMTTASNGDVYLTGEVVNKSDQPATLNTFAGALLDASGNVAGTSSFQDVTRLLSPAGDAAGTDRSPFVIHIPGPIKAGTTPNFYFDAVQGNPSDISAAADIHLHLDTSFADANNDMYVVATVTNSGTNTMTVRVMSGLYDQAGKVLDGSSTRAPIDLAPGASSPVPMYYFANLNGNADLIAQVVSYTAQIDPYWTYVVDSNFVILAASNVTTTIDGTSLSIKGDVANTSTQTLLDATVVITIHDANGKVVAADWALAQPDSGDFKPKTTQPWNTTIELPASVDPKTLKVDTVVHGDVKSQ
jgi:Protein of unknown function (DUF3426)